MAEKTAAAEAGEELDATAEEQQGADQTNRQDEIVADDEPEAIVTLARDMGWRPKEEFKGDPEQWKPATDFIRAGHDIQKNLGKELKSLRSTVDTMQRTSTTLLEQRLAEQREELTNRFNAAVEDGDADTARKLSTQIDKLAPPKAGPPPEATAFAEKHAAWFNKDPLATALAVETSNKLAHLSVGEQLAAAEREVRRAYPDLFPAPAKRQAAVHDSPRDARPGSRKQGFANLPPEAQKVALDMEDRLGIKRDDYAKNYFANQAQSGQARRA